MVTFLFLAKPWYWVSLGHMHDLHLILNMTDWLIAYCLTSCSRLFPLKRNVTIASGCVLLPCQSMILSIIRTQAWFTFDTEYDRLINCILFNILFENTSVKKVRHHCRWRAALFWFMLGAYSLLAGKHLYRAAPAMTVFTVSSGEPLRFITSYDKVGTLRTNLL